MNPQLTKHIRDAFIRSVMDDLPSIDFIEEATDILDQDVIDQLPPLVRRVWDDAQTRDFIEVSHRHRRCAGVFVSYMVIREIEPRREAFDRADALLNKHVEAEQRREALEAKLRAVVYGCKTRKALAEALPEFDKYLPPIAPPADRTVPVVANVVAEFVKAGWPKEVEA